jgi:ribonuclease HI
MSTDRPSRRRFALFTDGACAGNPGPGGWAFLLRDLGSLEETTGSGGEARTTNNRMELRAVIEGLEAIGEPAEVGLVSDSEYVVKGLTLWLPGWKRRGWRTTSGPVKNPDLWQALDRLASHHDLRAEWVRGHGVHRENIYCDRMAVAAIEEARRSGSH